MFVNPENIPAEDLPLIVFSDFSSGIIQSLIKIRTAGVYAHVMIMHRPGFFASQGNMFSEAPLKRYMKKGNRLKFFKIESLTVNERGALARKMRQDLTAPWWKRFYDYPGIIGQALGFRWINSPFRMYCSERVAAWLRACPRFWAMPYHPSPQRLNEIMKLSPDFKIYGFWDNDYDPPAGVEKIRINFT